VVLTLLVGALDSDAGRDAGKEGVGGDGSSAVSFGAAIRRILGSEAAFSLAMVLLFACLFTTMTSFQPTFAGARGLDYSVFYVAYTVAVIFSRFVLAGLTTRFDSRLVIAASVSVMALAVASFLAVGSTTLFYGISSALLGLGYGLALPSVQAQAVNVSEERVRPRVLPMGACSSKARSSASRWSPDGSSRASGTGSCSRSSSRSHWYRSPSPGGASWSPEGPRGLKKCRNPTSRSSSWC
jgi:hypothetical protein